MIADSTRRPETLIEPSSEQCAAAQIAAGKRNWKIPASFDSRAETYMVRNAVWKAAGMEPYGGCLCIGCLEKRIGRRLMPDDFGEHVFNTYFPGTPRLMERQGRYDPLGDWDERGEAVSRLAYRINQTHQRP